MWISAILVNENRINIMNLDLSITFIFWIGIGGYGGSSNGYNTGYNGYNGLSNSNAYATSYNSGNYLLIFSTLRLLEKFILKFS